MNIVAVLVAKTNEGVWFFPQEYAPEFYMIKGLLGLIATLMLIYHMKITWDHVLHHGTFGQQLRYYTLLAISILIAGGSAEQYKEAAVVNYRNLGAILVVCMLIVAMIVSIREDFDRRRRNGE